MLLKNLPAAGILSFVAVGFYETNVFISLVLCFMLIYLGDRDREAKERFIEMFKASLAVFFGAVLYMILYKAGLELSKREFYSQKNPSFSAMAEGTEPGSSVLGVLFRLVGKTIFECLGYMPIGFVADYMPVARILTALFFAIGGIMVVGYFLVSGIRGNEGIVTGTIIVLLTVSFFMTQSFITDCYVSQAVSMEDVRIVNAEIEKYEKETGFEIKTIASRRRERDARRYYDGSVVTRAFSYAMPIVYENGLRDNMSTT